MHTIKAISFDLDDTLWECEPAINRAEHALLTFLSERCQMIKNRYNEKNYHKKKIAFMRGNKQLQGDVSRMRKALLKELLADCAVHKGLVEEAFAHFYFIRSEVDLYADSIIVLQRLNQRYQLAALTNGNADLQQIGIAHLFSKILTASLECPAKPDPYMFLHTCKSFQIAPDQLLHVGDNPETDIAGARNAGAKTVWINRTAMDWPAALPCADFEVKDLHELNDLLLH